MVNPNEQNVKSDVLGNLQKPLAEGEYYVEPEVVSKPLVLEDTVIRACCLGCGYCLEIIQPGAVHLAKLAGFEDPPSWQGRYFETKRCPVCDTDYRDVLLVEISQTS